MLAKITKGDPKGAWNLAVSSLKNLLYSEAACISGWKGMH